MNRSRLALLAALFLVVGSLPSCVLAIGNTGTGCSECEHCHEQYSEGETYGLKVEEEEIQEG